MRLRALWLVVAAVLVSGIAGALPFDPVRARLATLDLRLDDAASILEGDEDSPAGAVEGARLALYRGDCDRAVALLERPDLDEEDDEIALLFAVAKGCARATAGTVIETDATGQVEVRLQDDADRALVPYLAEVALKARDQLEEDLGARLPNPIRIDLLRDQFALAAHTGLPEEAAQTTGTVAVAKWGRVLMISPRAAPHGYPWMDTLTHELTHLVLSMATRDRAPLWLQEGVAKRQETRWREATMYDAVPSPDAVAWYGIQEDLALPLDGLGPSIAMLPSAEQATVAFAEVASFISFWVDLNGADALPALLKGLGTSQDSVSDLMKAQTGKTLAEWDEAWRAALAQQAPSLPEAFRFGQARPNGNDAARRRRLAQLLLERGHPDAAAIQAKEAHELLAEDASLRCLYADTLRAQGREVEAAALVARPGDIASPNGRWWSLHGFTQLDGALPHAVRHAVGIEPYDPGVACQELPWGELPADPTQRALCEAAWRLPANRP